RRSSDVELAPRLGRLYEEHRELVAAPTADDVDAPRVLQEEVRHHAEGVIPGPMTQLVVDALEPVEVEQDDGQRMVETAEARGLFLEAGGEEPPGVEAGDVVLEGEFLEARVRELELLVGALQPLGELVDLARLVLNGGQHARDRVHNSSELADPHGAHRP